jgi:CheY-like chemotaxis protein
MEQDKKRILIVDDEPLVRRSLSRVLANRFEVSEAFDGISGLEKWRQERPSLIFLDILMPGLTGLQVLEEIEPEIRRTCRVILMSAYSGATDPVRSTADFFMTKPIEDIFSVPEKVEELLRN